MNSIKDEVAEIVHACDNVFLSTINLENFPETRGMSNIMNKDRDLDDHLNIYFATHWNSPKIEHIKKNDKASLSYLIYENMKNMTLFGKIELVNDKKLKESLWKNELSMHYRHGKDDEQYCVVKFTPISYKHYVFNKDAAPRKVEGRF